MFKVSQFEPKVLRWWLSQKMKIDFTPAYQRRGRLWSKSDKAYLIDSIINQYDIPKVYVADFTFGNSTLNEKKLPYAIIDGKQRFEAIFDFFEGSLTLDNSFVYEENKSLKLGGLGYQDLKKNYPDVADVFDNFHLSVMRVVADEEDKINELFVRLNRSKPLTGAEIRNAMIGPVPGLVRYIANHEVFKSYIHFTVTRGQDLNAAAKLLLFEFYEKPSETKKKNLDQFTEQAKTISEEKLELASRRVIDVLNRMSEIFLPSDPLLSSAGVFPVYYWLIRQSEEEIDLYLREFLNNFEKERKHNREIAKQDEENVDKELILYDKFNRSTNDLKSHTERYDILRRRLQDFP